MKGELNKKHRARGAMSRLRRRVIRPVAGGASVDHLLELSPCTMSCMRDVDLNELLLEHLDIYGLDEAVLRQLREQLEEPKRKRAKKEADETTRLEKNSRYAQDGSLPVTVRTLVAEGSFHMKSWSTVSDLRAMIAQDMGIPSWSQGLALGTRHLAPKENHTVLAEIGVNPCNATFTVI